MKKLIHKKQINRMTSATFSYNDVVIVQEGEMVILEKDEILELAQLIQNERHDLEFFKKQGELKNERNRKARVIRRTNDNSPDRNEPKTEI
jgi:hypothetical protein